MGEYLTAEEEYELMYGEELDMMNEFDEPENIVNAPIASTQKSSAHKNTSILSSPALSQISRANFHSTPVPNQNLQKKTSTPFLEKLKEIDEEGTENINPEKNKAYNEIQNFGVKRKRRLEDLFGDIYDIEEEDALLKKHKTEEQRDLETIQKILDARKVFDSQINPLKQTNYDRYEAMHKFKKENLSQTIPKFPFIPLSRDDDRIYVRFHSVDFENQKLQEIKAFDVRKSSFFGSQKEKIWNEANQIVVKGLENTSQANNCIQFQQPVGDSVDLWVEKYKPKKYLDLLSDESINRSLLQWIKLWDKVVFGRDITKVKAKTGELSNFNKKTGRFEQNGGWQKRRQKNNLNTDLDENGVPVQKIALLVGKPGLGKTTLAHIVAKHAGYEVREMNASDDRQVESFRQILENCTQMKSVMNRDNRPNCIILDEIDGAPLPSIEFLIRFATGQVGEKAKKGKNNKKFILKRPIICICNDLYGANLRTLRQMAFVINFQSIDSGRLAERLMQISNREHVKTDLTTLLALAEKSGNDIRSCVSMIQFFSSMQKPLTLFDVLKSDVGQKDQHKTLFNVWASIFQIQRPKKVIKQTEMNEQKEVIGMSDMSIKTRMSNVLDAVSSCGEYEKLSNGIFENYLKQKFQDFNMTGTVEAMRWFCFNDIVQDKINSLQNYSIYPYLQYAFVSWHFNFASLAYPSLTYPQKQYEVSQKLQASKQIFNSLKKGIVTNMHGIGSGSELLLDTIGLLRIIINPEIRSVSMHLLTQKEKDELQHTVEIIADFGLTFNQLQTNDGTYTYRIDPDVDFFTLPGIPTKQTSYWSKQTIAQEVQVEKMRRARPKLSYEDVERNDVEMSETLKSSNEKNTSPTTENKMLPNFLQKLIPKSIKSAKPTHLVCKDFFGRVVTKSSVVASASQEPASNDVLVKSNLWFKYKEGYNNAVRTDIHFSDLL